MIVQMKTLAAGPQGILMAGHQYDIPKEQAEAWIKSGNAEAVQGRAKVAKPKRDESASPSRNKE